MNLPKLFRFFSQFSLRTLHAVGAAGGLLVYWGSAKERRRLKENMTNGMLHSLGKKPTGAQLRKNAREAGKMMMEMPFMWLRPYQDIRGTVKSVHGWDMVESARMDGAPILAITPHMGCFEIISSYVGAFVPLTILYRPPKQEEIEPIMRQGRAREQIRLAPADMSGVRRLLKALLQGEMAGLLPDQVPGQGEGIWSPFFGRPAYTMTLAARLSEVKNVRVLFFWGERLPKGKGFIIHVKAPKEPIEGTLEERVHAINREVECLVSLCPEQYLWSYNRYKVPAGVQPPQKEASC